MPEQRVSRTERIGLYTALCAGIAVGAVLLVTTGLRVFVFSPPLALLIFIIYRAVRRRQGVTW